MLPETGSISMSQVNVELKKSETAVISLNDTDVRKLAGKPSGIISMNDLRGKKASEYVENYKVYSINDSGRDITRQFKIEFPHKVINGHITIFYKGYTGLINILGQQFGCRNPQSYRNSNINLENNTLEISGNYHISEQTNSNGSTTEGWIDFYVTFTGEWEA